MKRWIAVFLVASTVTLASRATGAMTPSAGVAEVTRQVYISAVDSAGTPVTDLTAADIAVKEDGKERPVADLQPAVAPMHVAILVEDGGLGSFQHGVAQFLQRSIGHGQFSITLLTPQASPVVDFTDDAAALKSALGRLGVRGRVQTDGDQLLDAIAHAAKSLQQRKAERPIILALTVAGGQPQSIEPRDVLSDASVEPHSFERAVRHGRGPGHGARGRTQTIGRPHRAGRDGNGDRRRAHQDRGRATAAVSAHLHAARRRQTVRTAQRVNIAQRHNADVAVAHRNEVTGSLWRRAPEAELHINLQTDREARFGVAVELTKGHAAVVPLRK